MSDIVTFQLTTGDYVVGALVENKDGLDTKGYTINKPITFQEHFDPQAGPRTISVPYGAPFLASDHKEDRNLYFKIEHILLDPIKATERMTSMWYEVTGVVKTQPQGLVIVK